LRFAIEDLARTFVMMQRHERAARLFSAADALRQATGALLSRGTREEYERVVAKLRIDLGDQVFQQAWAEGLRPPLEALAEDVLSDKAASVAHKVDRSSVKVGILTPREREVASLIGQGLSNRQIADKLVITIGTAGVHVEHILRKLDLRSRHQVATWALVNGLVSD
jgi:DNA-binding NarL/FixJ family response regulator